jgi:hypothetical protein
MVTFNNHYTLIVLGKGGINIFKTISTFGAVLFLLISLSAIPSSGETPEDNCLIEFFNHEFKSDGFGANVVFFGILGNCGWYISCVTIYFIYSPDIVNIWYQIDDGNWIDYLGGSYPICEDGEHTVCWKYEDNQGNISDIECKDFKIDQTPPNMTLEWESFKEGCNWFVKFTINATDETSGLNGRLWLFINEGLHDVFEDFLDWPVEFTIQWFEALSYCKFKFTCCDYAGNEANVSVNGSDIESHSSNKIINQISYNIWFLRLFYMFLILNPILRVLQA